MATIIGVAAGLVLGVAFTAVAFRLRNRSAALPESEAHELSFADRAAVSTEFAAHALSVRRELSRYADELADGDNRLREQLRRFEAVV